MCDANCVAPGLTQHTWFGVVHRRVRRRQAHARSTRSGRIGEPSDIADAVLFLASDLSSWVTGQVLSVNGGYTTVG